MKCNVIPKESISYTTGDQPGGGGVPLRSPLPTPFCTCRWISRYPASMYASKSGKKTHWWSLSCYVRPYTIILRLYAFMYWTPIAWQGWHVIITILPTLVCIQTHANIYVRMLSACCSLVSRIDVRSPLSAKICHQTLDLIYEPLCIMWYTWIHIWIWHTPMYSLQ